MGWVGYLAALLIFISVSFAYIIESGDAGTQFVQETSAIKCQEPDVQAVYECLGNVVRVVSSVPGEGSTFYKPDGKVVRCPVVPPSEMGAECLQMMTPNYCPIQAECGYSPAPEVFPGQNDTPEQTGDIDYYVVEGMAATGNVSQEPEPLEAPEPYVPKKKNATPRNDFDAPAASTGNLDWAFGYLVYVVLLLGVGAVGVLFMLFRNSLSEEEA
ncbi:MAG: hypothetical protein AB1529_01225 [Candidatus Micrarchaeota archaeon]